QLVPEPLAVDIDPALAFAVGVPAAVPAEAAMAEPTVAVIAAADHEVARDRAVDASVDASVNVSVDAKIPVDVNAPVDVLLDGDAFVLVVRRCERRRRERKSKRGNDGQHDGNLLQHRFSPRVRWRTIAKGRLAPGSCWQGARERTMNGMLRLRCCAAIFLQPARSYECAITGEVPPEACVARRQRLYSGAKPPAE